MRRLGITSKLFLVVFATCLLVALAMGIAARESFVRGFLGYLNEQGLERIDDIMPAFQKAWRQHGSWDFLQHNPRVWFRLLRPSAAGEPPATGSDGGRSEPGGPPPPDVTGASLRIALLDAARQRVAGHPDVKPDAPMRPIEVNGQVVGYLALVPFEQITAAAALRFQQQQLIASWIIGASSLALVAVIAMWLSRWLLTPLTRIAEATHRLAAGDYGVRIHEDSRDEIGRLAEDFNGLALALQKNERMRREFMADVSHELRTPLAVLRGELEAIEDGVRPLTTDAVHSLQAEVATLSKLVNDLYDLSLSDVGALSYRKVNVDVTETLRGALDSFAARLAERGIAVDADLPDEALIVDADEARLRQLFTNLLENTLRYTDAGGRLHIRCTRNGDGADIEFEDSAPGVADALLPRLFDRFYRVESSRARASGGAGLGLAICRNIVEAHGGRIDAGPSALGGLRVTTRLPLSVH